MDFESIGMRLFDESTKCFRLIAHYGISPKMLQVLECIGVDEGFQAEAFRTKWPVYTSDMAAEPNLVGGKIQDLDYRSLICVPLVAGDKVLGTMELVTKQKREWPENEVRWLALFGRSIGVLARNVQLSNQLMDMSTLQERTLLAQEIHDGLAQLIGSIRLWAEDAQLSLKEEKLRDVENAIDKIEHTARDAYSSIREEMLGLRDTILPGKNFISVLSEYLKRYQRQWGIETRLNYQNGHRLDDKLPISAMAEIQLLRIIQEAVTNVRRHAEATHVFVSIVEDDDHLLISIRDDGKGFNPDETRDGNLGLRIMNERAASIGGEIDIKTQTDQGTEMKIKIPTTHTFL
jgi:signal transduction histidine kinase